ncbi:MAG: hypothetical protein ACK4UP_10900 [Spirosomataceae bacterium]
MRNFFYSFLAFVLMVNFASAQGEQGRITEFSTLTYFRPTSKNLNGGGIGLTGGILYGLTDKLSVGGAAEASLSFFNQTTGDGGGSLNAWYGGRAIGEYYLTTNKVKPFVGMGVGALNTGSFSLSSSAADAEASTKFVFGPRAGILLGNFRLSMEYSIVPKKISATTGEYNLSFIGFHIGTHFGSSW